MFEFAIFTNKMCFWCIQYYCFLMLIKNELGYISMNFVIYLEKKYIGFYRNKIKQETLFGINTWSCYSRAIWNFPRSPNSVEYLDRSLKNRCEMTHTNMARLLDCVQTEQKTVRIKKYELRGVSFGVNLKRTQCNFQFIMWWRTSIIVSFQNIWICWWKW